MDKGHELIDEVDFEKCGGFVPTIVCDAEDGKPRMLAYSTIESLTIALREGIGAYWSRSRQSLWRKGATSGDVQRLVGAHLDCDRDTLLFYVEQTGVTCHLGNDNCFSDAIPFTWSALIKRVRLRASSQGPRSYTRALLANGELLEAKLREEADELARASTADEVAWECADLLYFMTVKMHAAGIGIAHVMEKLAERAK